MGEEGHANVLRYQMNRLLSGDDVIRMFRSDSLTSCHLQDRVMNNRVNSSREKNPFIFCEILEHQVFLLGSRMGLWESRIERRQSKWCGLDLIVFRRCRHQGKISSLAMTLRTNSIEN